MDKKKWYKSKTLWLNGIAMGAIFLSSNLGFEMSSEETGGILVIVNMILRAITKSGLE